MAIISACWRAIRRGGRPHRAAHQDRATPSVYDALLLPALNYAERDRLEQRLSPEEETAVIDATRELLSDAVESIRRLNPEPPEAPDHPPLPGPREPLRVLGYATNGVADELALAMLAHVLDICQSPSKLPGRACRPRSSCRSCTNGGSRSCASPICHPAPRQRRAISSRGSTPHCPKCESWSGGGHRQRWRTRARRCCGIRGRISWPRRCWRAGRTWAGSGDPADPVSGNNRRAGRVATDISIPPFARPRIQQAATGTATAAH